MKTWHAVAGVVGGLAAIGLGARLLRPKKRCFLELLFLVRDRDRPDELDHLRQPDPWRALDEDPVVLGEPGGITGHAALSLPSRYNKDGVALFGVSAEVLALRLRKQRRQAGETGHPGWYIEIRPKQAGTTSFAVGDESGALEHVAIAIADPKPQRCKA